MTPLGDPARRHTSAHNHTPPRYHKYYTVDKLFGIVILFLLYYCWVSSSPRMIDPLNSYLYVCLYIYLTCIYSLSRSINRILLDFCNFCILSQLLQHQLYFKQHHHYHYHQHIYHHLSALRQAVQLRRYIIQSRAHEQALPLCVHEAAG